MLITLQLPVLSGTGGEPKDIFAAVAAQLDNYLITIVLPLFKETYTNLDLVNINLPW